MLNYFKAALHEKEKGEENLKPGGPVNVYD